MIRVYKWKKTNKRGNHTKKKRKAAIVYKYIERGEGGGDEAVNSLDSRYLQAISYPTCPAE